MIRNRAFEGPLPRARRFHTYRTAAAAAGRSLHERFELGIEISARFRLSLELLTTAATPTSSAAPSSSSSARPSPIATLASSSSSRTCSRAASYAAL